MKTLLLSIALLFALTGCQKECPKPVIVPCEYPKMEKKADVEKISIIVNKISDDEVSMSLIDYKKLNNFIGELKKQVKSYASEIDIYNKLIIKGN